MKLKTMTSRKYVQSKNDAFNSGNYKKWIQLKVYQVRWLYKNHNKCKLVIGEKDAHLLLQTLEKKIKNLQEFSIWMSGCGYDFSQHEYFNKMRDKLLKKVI